MKRCVVTFMGPEDKPLFDMLVYGVTKTEFLSAQGLEALDALDQRLRLRNMKLDDFEGIQVNEPAVLPIGSVKREYSERGPTANW